MSAFFDFFNSCVSILFDLLELCLKGCLGSVDGGLAGGLVGVGNVKLGLCLVDKKLQPLLAKMMEISTIKSIVVYGNISQASKDALGAMGRCEFPERVMGLAASPPSRH